ncbi:MAG: hypothetical protein E6J26_07195 [Chloroflexi bacterium]|jgi:capsular polysaccharide biosynthesis protein|nr:MAG: hypothetical protein E6J26_07195 [Chloroflexota bacterium]
MRMDLRDYLKILRKRWWIIVLVAVVAAGSAFAFSKAQTPIYRSAVKLSIVPARPSDYGQTLAIKNVLRNYVQQLTTRKMAQQVVNRLQLDIAPEALLGKVGVVPDEADYTISIETKDPLPSQAQRISQTLAELFVQERQIRNLEVAQQDRILTEIVDNASDPDLFSPKTSINVLAGAVLGGLIGVVIVFALEWFESDIVRSGEDVERYLGVPVIGSIPTISARDAQAASAPRPRLAFWKRA